MRGGIVAALLFATPVHAQSLTNAAAKAPSVAFSEVLYGQKIDDPYRWMENPARKPDMVAYVRAQSDFATAELRKLPGRDDLAKLIDRVARAGTRNFDVRQSGSTTFWLQIDPADRVPKLMARSATGSRVLYDPAHEASNPAGPAAINSYSVSPDGKLVALHVSYGGAEIGAVRFIDSATGLERLARLEPVWGEFKVAWLDGGKVIFTRMAKKKAGGDEMQGMIALAGTPGGIFTPILGPDVQGGPAFARTAFPDVAASNTSDWVIGLSDNAGSDPIVYVARRADLEAGKSAWRQVAGPADKILDTALLGSDLYMITQRSESNGRTERLSVAGGAAEVVPAPAGYVLTDIVAAKDGIYLATKRDGVSHVFFFPGGKSPAQEVALPFEADHLPLNQSGDGSAVTITLGGWTVAPRSFLMRGGKLVSLDIDSFSWPDAANLSVTRQTAISADGTAVPMVIIAPPPTRQRLALIEAYGSYGIPMTAPTYNSARLSWSVHGNIMVYCGTRGGNERGRAWWDAGRRENKPNAHADFIACAERLVQLGLAKPKGIGATGTSAGGLLVPIAVEKRPDLFGALLSRVAELNATRLAAGDNGANQFVEMGDPGTPDGWHALAAQDAYMGLQSARDLPDTLLTVGLNDHRVAPWASAKFAARAQQRFGDHRLVLIRAEPEGGHGIGSARDLSVAEYADSFAFLENTLAR